MRKLIVYSSVFLLVLNLISKLIFSSYEMFNLGLTSMSIISSGGLLFCLTIGKINHAYQISLSFFYTLLMLIKLIISLVSPSSLENNLFIPILIGIFMFEVIFLMIVRYMRKFTK